jgi:hypothetical protein
MSDQTTTDAPAVEQTTDAPASVPVQLQIQDLILTAQVLQLVTQRGAIKAEEMEAVGGLYNRLVSFLQSSGALQPSTADTPTGESAPADPAATPSA